MAWQKGLGIHSMSKVSYVVRKITIPPVFALALLVLIYIFHPEYIGSAWQLLLAVVFLAGLPTLAYPLQKYIPQFKDKGRDGQRSLAMLFSFAGYFLGTMAAFLLHSPIELRCVYLEYLLCGIAMLAVNKLFRIKASGHACGIVGPVLIMVYFKLFIPALICALFIVPVCVSSIKTKRHTPAQLIGGSIIPLAMLVLVHVIMRG